MPKSKVAVLKSKPESILTDIQRLMKMAEVSSLLSKDSTTILKDNISWHFPYLSANTTPWQMEGVIQSLRSEGFNDLVSIPLVKRIDNISLSLSI